MKRHILLLFLILLVWGAQAQSRKEIANFSHYQQYYNPSLTGYNGSVLKTLYRNQWTGFEDAPKTIFASAELDMQRLTGKKNGFRVDSREGRSYLHSINPKHALGFSVIHDRFGPSSETQLSLSYGSGIRLSEQLALRWGSAITYNSNKLDGNSLTVDQENDPRYSSVLGQMNGVSKVDLNLGLSLASANFYMGVAMLDITEGKIITSGDDFLNDMFVRRYVGQTGYRSGLTEQIGIAVSGLFQYDELHKSSLEGQLKVIYDNALWVGIGYRKERAYNVGAGIKLNQLSIAYAYETPVQEAHSIRKATNEISIKYNLFMLTKPSVKQQVMIW